MILKKKRKRKEKIYINIIYINIPILLDMSSNNSTKRVIHQQSITRRKTSLRVCRQSIRVMTSGALEEREKRRREKGGEGEREKKRRKDNGMGGVDCVGVDVNKFDLRIIMNHNQFNNNKSPNFPIINHHQFNNNKS